MSGNKAVAIGLLVLACFLLLGAVQGQDAAPDVKEEPVAAGEPNGNLEKQFERRQTGLNVYKNILVGCRKVLEPVQTLLRKAKLEKHVDRLVDYSMEKPMQVIISVSFILMLLFYAAVPKSKKNKKIPPVDGEEETTEVTEATKALPAETTSTVRRRKVAE